MATEGITSPGLMRVNWCKNNERGGGLFFSVGAHMRFFHGYVIVCIYFKSIIFSELITLMKRYLIAFDSFLSLLRRLICRDVMFKRKVSNRISTRIF